MSDFARRVEDDITDLKWERMKRSQGGGGRTRSTSGREFELLVVYAGGGFP